MKNLIFLLFAFIALFINAKSQNTGYNSVDEVFERYQDLMQTKQIEVAKKLLKSNKSLFDSEEDGEDIYNFYLGITAMASYMNAPVIDSLIVDLPFIDFCMSVIMENYQESNPTDIWKFLYSASEIYKVLKNPKIEGLYQFATNYYKLFPADNYRTFHHILDNVGFYYVNTSQFQNSLNVFGQDYELLNSNNDSTIDIPRNLCIAGRLFLHQLNDKEKAINCLLGSYSLYQNFKSEQHNNEFYYYLLEDLSSIYFGETNLPKSMEYATELRDLLKSDNNTQSELYLSALWAMSNASGDSKSLVKYAEEAYYASLGVPDEHLKSLAIQKLLLCYSRAKTPKNEQIDLNNDIAKKQDTNITFLFDEATIELNNGNIQSAKEKLWSLVDYYESSENTFNDDGYSKAIVSLMQLYVIKEGDAPLADQLYWRASNFYEANGYTSNNHRYYAAAEGFVQLSLNNYTLAKNYFESALNLFNEFGDTHSINYISCLNSLAIVYLRLNDKVNARIYIDTSKDLIDEMIGVHDKESLSFQLTVLNNIGLIYGDLGYSEKSAEIFKEVVAKCNGEEYNDVKILALNNLAVKALAARHFSEAKQYNEQLMKLPMNGNYRWLITSNLLLYKYFMKDTTIIGDLTDFKELTMDEVSSVFGSFIETERENYWNEVTDQLQIYNMVADKFQNPKAIALAYDNAVFSKSVLLKSTKLCDDIVYSSGNSQLIHNYNQAKKLEENVSAKATSQDSLYKYYSQAFQLKKQVLLSIPNFKDRLKSSFAQWQDVQQMLSNNDIAIEFVVIPRFVAINNWDRYYAALVLGKDDAAPRMVTLCNIDSLKALVKSGDPNDSGYINKLYSLRDERLYNYIWKHLESELTPGANIYFSPTGYINAINLNAIPHKGKRMDEFYRLYQVSSTAEIANVKQSKSLSIHSAAIYGDVDYGETLQEMELYAQSYSTRGISQAIPYSQENATRAWGTLSYTKDEAEAINDLFIKSDAQTKLWMGGSANEESFKAMSGNAPDIIHVATHGFYFKNKQEMPTDYFRSIKSFTTKGSSMIYSGLLFAGANNAWTGNEMPSNTEDGILTALEIGQLDLSNTKIVTLSACQTALGDIDEVNGVLGLQRGFKQAGVGSIVMSLWEVPDAETCELMTEFYRILLSGVEKHEAFRQAQKELRARKLDPYYWAAFVLLD